MIPSSLEHIVNESLVINGDRITIINETKLRHETIDKLVYESVFGDPDAQSFSRWLIWETAQELGIYPSSIHPLYMARSRQVVPLNFTVPAMNFRGLVYDTARALFKSAVNTHSQAFVCELARGEMGYTDQTPAEYTASILAGAIREGYVGPVFIQGDHFQPHCSSQPGIPDKGEMEALTQLIKDSISAGFYNIDIDTSTLVDLKKTKLEDQQAPNIHYTAELLKLIRSLEPAGITISVGGEIGHIGGKNSTLADFTTYMDGLIQACPDIVLISKISVATGTDHGGIINPDGSLAHIKVDYNVLKTITETARHDYHLAGAVQHGASTLPDDTLHLFVQTEAIEIHRATKIQNIILDHLSFPQSLLSKMYVWLQQSYGSEREPGWTDAQFNLKLRKKCWGYFKKETWDLSDTIRRDLREALEHRFEFIFKELNVNDSEELVSAHIPVQEIHKQVSDFIIKSKLAEVSGLSD